MWRRKVLWSEGQFLRPQHFQQHDRYFEHLVDRRARVQQSYGWGFESISIDDSTLGMGQFSLESGSGVLPDGSVFSFPGDDEAPEAIAISAEVAPQLVYLVSIVDRQGADSVSLDQGETSEMRYGCTTIDIEDVNAGFDEPAPVQVGNLSLSLVLHENLSGRQAAMPVARFVERRSDGRLVLDADFVSPALSVGENNQLRGYLRDLLGLLRGRSEALATQMNHPGRGGVAEVADFLFLKEVNRYGALLEHLDNVPMLHPEQLYRMCVGLAGELSSFGGERRLLESFPAYNHDDLQLSFGPVLQSLRVALSAVIERPAISIELQDRGYGVRVAMVADKSLLSSASFVLAVNADMPGDALRQRFSNQVKLGPIEKIRDLVNLQLPGISAQPMPVAPRQIPYNAGYTYFELDRGHEMWAMLEKSGGLAMHLPDEFPGLEMEFWAIRG